MTLREHIAKALMHSRIGMTRKELGDVIAEDIYSGDLNRISDQLFHLQKAKHVEKSGGFNNSANRWAITSTGRAFYSDLNDDETHDQIPTKTYPLSAIDDDPRPESESAAQNSDGQLLSDSRMVLDSVQQQMGCMETPDAQTPVDQPIQANEVAHSEVRFDPFKDIYTELQSTQITLQRAQEKLKRIPTAPRIQHKQEKLATLRLVQQTIGLFNGDVEEILQQIYQDIDQMEAA